MGPGRRFHGCRAVLSLSGEAVELAKLLTARMMPTVVVATVGPTPQIHRLWSTALALDKGLVRGHIDGYAGDPACGGRSCPARHDDGSRSAVTHRTTAHIGAWRRTVPRN